MVIWSVSRMRKHRDFDHQNDAPHFTSLKGSDLKSDKSIESFKFFDANLSTNICLGAFANPPTPPRRF